MLEVDTTMTEKESLLQTWEREFKTTLRVLKNIPQEKMDLRPSEKSRSTRDLLGHLSEKNP